MDRHSNGRLKKVSEGPVEFCFSHAGIGVAGFDGSSSDAHPQHQEANSTSAIQRFIFVSPCPD